MGVKEQALFGCNVFAWIVFGVIIVALLTAGWLVAWPAYNNYYNTGIRSGYEYTSTKTDVLNTLMLSWLDLDTKIKLESRSDIADSYRAQQRGIIKKMLSEEVLTAQISPDVKAFINAHRGD